MIWSGIVRNRNTNPKRIARKCRKIKIRWPISRCSHGGRLAAWRRLCQCPYECADPAEERPAPQQVERNDGRRVVVTQLQRYDRRHDVENYTQAKQQQIWSGPDDLYD